MNPNLIFLDTETTGKGPDDRLLQVAYKYLEYSFSKLFKPPVAINFEAMATHHITETMVADKKPFAGSEMFNNLKTLFQPAGKILVAHNAPFDIAMLEREGLTVPRYIDTLKVAQVLFDEPLYKLQYLRYRFSLEVSGIAHSADGDVAVLEQLFYFLFRKSSEVKQMTEDEFTAWALDVSVKPILLRHIMFGKYRGMAFADVPKDYLQWLQKQPDNDENLKFTLEHYLNPVPVPDAATVLEQQKLI